MTKKKNGICCICGKEGKLTFEHIPPHAAFNHSNLKMYDVIRYLRSNQTRYPSLQNGAGLWSLCSSCNNLTGTWYGNSYIEFVEQGIKYYQRNAKGILAVPYTIYPLRVFKQIVSCFASINGSDWCENNPAVRKFLLKPEERFFLQALTLECICKAIEDVNLVGRPQFLIFSPASDLLEASSHIRHLVLFAIVEKVTLTINLLIDFFLFGNFLSIDTTIELRYI